MFFKIVLKMLCYTKEYMMVCINSEEANNKAIRKEKGMLTSEIYYWSITANARPRECLTHDAILNKFNSTLIVAWFKYPLKIPISTCHCTMSTGIIQRHKQPFDRNPVCRQFWLWYSSWCKSSSKYSWKRYLQI